MGLNLMFSPIEIHRLVMLKLDGVGGIKNSKHRGSMSDSVDERNSKLARTDNSSDDHPMTEQEDFIN